MGDDSATEAALRITLYEITFAMNSGFAPFVPEIAEAHLLEYPEHEWAVEARIASEQIIAGRGTLDEECAAACSQIEAANAAGRWGDAVRIGAMWSNRSRAAGYFPPRELADRLTAAVIDDPVAAVARATATSRAVA